MGSTLTPYSHTLSEDVHLAQRGRVSSHLILRRLQCRQLTVRIMYTRTSEPYRHVLHPSLVGFETTTRFLFMTVLEFASSSPQRDSVRPRMHKLGVETQAGRRATPPTYSLAHDGACLGNFISQAGGRNRRGVPVCIKCIANTKRRTGLGNGRCQNPGMLVGQPMAEALTLQKDLCPLQKG